MRPDIPHGTVESSILWALRHNAFRFFCIAVTGGWPWNWGQSAADSGQQQVCGGIIEQDWSWEKKSLQGR